MGLLRLLSVLGVLIVITLPGRPAFAQTCTADDCPYATGSVEGHVSARGSDGRIVSMAGVRIQLWAIDGDPLWAHSYTEARINASNSFRFDHIATGTTFWLELPDFNQVGGPCTIGQVFAIQASQITESDFTCQFYP
jgi:hypothetical protein